MEVDIDQSMNGFFVNLIFVGSHQVIDPKS